MNSAEIRQQFFDYFQQKGHHLVNSSPLVPANDPTLLFTNAGMVQFKETFLGSEPRSYQRAVSSQRCVRAGGKHNDLDNVGYTARHHTFFEMLGNFSFGDYFKREAIAFAWEFLTKVLSIPEDKLWVTVYTEDDEAADIWLKEMKVSTERFSRCGEKDNFWSMGDTGPCGPCTEIFYDHGPAIAGGPPGSPDEDGDRYVEIWNLVFMQYNRDNRGKLSPLPKPSVDTGMGLERIAAVVQGVHSNYDIDLFVYIIEAVKALCPADVDTVSPSLNVIADHIRACAFLICDGVVPSNEGRGYVLRRVIRRAIRHGNKLGIDEYFFYQLASPLSQIMGEAYPELVEYQSLIERVLKQEEEQFARTIDNGLRLLHGEIKKLTDNEISGELAFKLYDTYGFPVDLTADIAREQQLVVDTLGFDKLMQQQRLLSQGESQFKVDYSESIDLQVDSEFCGYNDNKLSATVQLILVDEQQSESVSEGQSAIIVLNKSPFYAESGGQVGDTGWITSQNGKFLVEDTIKKGEAILHLGKMKKGEFTLNEPVEACIDDDRRDAIALNHSATHLLHAALKQVIGSHVQQKGSLVSNQRARFDFSHFEGLTQEQVLTVESLVNDNIRHNYAVVTEVMAPEQAQKSGATALFGEKYGDKVRVLTMGKFSKELCGGTHVKRTGDIGLFKIVSESGIAAGVRRIEMITGSYALKWVNQQLVTQNRLTALLKSDSAAVVDKLSQFLHEVKQKDKELDRLKAKFATQSGDDLLSQIRVVNGVNLLAVKLEGVDAKALRATLDQIKTKVDNAVIVLVVATADKMNVVAGLSKNLVGEVPSAREFVKYLCGKGGGRDDMAQGGGKLPADLEQKLQSIGSLIGNNSQ